MEIRIMITSNLLVDKILIRKALSIVKKKQDIGRLSLGVRNIYFKLVGVNQSKVFLNAF